MCMTPEEVALFCEQLTAVTKSWWTGDLFITPDPYGWIAVFYDDMDTEALYDAISDMVEAWDKVDVDEKSYTNYTRPGTCAKDAQDKVKP